jgi:predicted secreted protein
VPNDRFLDALARDGEQVRAKLEKVSEQLIRLLEESSGNAVWRMTVDAQLKELRHTQQQVSKNQAHIERLRVSEERRRKRVTMFWAGMIPLMIGSCGKLIWDFVSWYSKQ